MNRFCLCIFSVFMGVSTTALAQSSMTQARSDTFACAGKAPTKFGGNEGIRPSDTRFVSQSCRLGGPKSLKVGGYVPGTNRCYNLSLSCGVRGSRLSIFNSEGKFVSSANARPGCPNGRATYDAKINATQLKNAAGSAGYLIAQARSGSNVSCFVFRPTCAIRLGNETNLDPRKYSGIDRPSGANPSCGSFTAPNPVAR